jgi:SnoaL-like domain
MESTRRLEDEAAVRHTVTSVVHEIDARNWSELRRQFEESVVTDYTSLFGGEVQTQRADDLVGAWRRLLTPVKATQHLLGPIDVALRPDGATARCHVRAYHYAPGAPGGSEWMVAGHYVFELRPTADAWRIHRLTLITFQQTGNLNLLQEVSGG